MFSLEAQHRVLEDYCQHNGHSIALFVDAGISGETISARPEFGRLLDEVKAGHFDVVLAVDADRYSRASDLGDWQTIKRTFREAGIKWGTPSQWMHESKFITDVLSAVSAEEKRKILARTWRGKLEAVRQGKYLASNPPFGYRTEGGRLYVNDAEAAIVRRIFSMAFAGGTIRGIARQLTDELVPSPMTMRGDARQGKEWRVTTVSRILHNPTYTGVATWNKRSKIGSGQIKVEVPRFFDSDHFDIVNNLLKRHVTFVPRNQQRFYLLKGLLFCECGRRMFGQTFHGKRYYRCHGTRNKECNRPGLRADELERIVSRESMDALMNPEAVRTLAAQQRTESSPRDEALMRLDALNHQLARIPEAHSRIIDLRIEGVISKAQLKGKIDELETRGRRLERERDALQVTLGQEADDELTAMRLAELLAKHRPYLSYASSNFIGLEVMEIPGKDWTEIIRTMVKRITVQKDGKPRIEAIIPVDPGAAQAAPEHGDSRPQPLESADRRYLSFPPLERG
jgi:site-specific DNA recombinase